MLFLSCSHSPPAAAAFASAGPAEAAAWSEPFGIGCLHPGHLGHSGLTGAWHFSHSTAKPAAARSAATMESSSVPAACPSPPASSGFFVGALQPGQTLQESLTGAEQRQHSLMKAGSSSMAAEALVSGEWPGGGDKGWAASGWAAEASKSGGGCLSALQPGQRGQLERTGAWHFQHGAVSSKAAPASATSSSCAAAPAWVSESLDLHAGHRGQPCLHGALHW